MSSLVLHYVLLLWYFQWYTLACYTNYTTKRNNYAFCYIIFIKKNNIIFFYLSALILTFITYTYRASIASDIDVTLMLSDYARRFDYWNAQYLDENQSFLFWDILGTDEPPFIRVGILIVHNVHDWSLQNLPFPRSTIQDTLAIFL